MYNLYIEELTKWYPSADLYIDWITDSLVKLSILLPVSESLLLDSVTLDLLSTGEEEDDDDDDGFIDRSKQTDDDDRDGWVTCF